MPTLGCFKRHFLSATLVCAVFTVALGAARSDDSIDWNSYMQTAPVAAAIASAIAQVDHCSVRPLLIEEIESGENARTLVFTCDGNEDEEGSAILKLERFGDSDWMPKGFEYAR